MMLSGEPNPNNILKDAADELMKTAQAMRASIKSGGPYAADSVVVAGVEVAAHVLGALYTGAENYFDAQEAYDNKQERESFKEDYKEADARK